jgi:nucleotide-binding universal stress UspA family protein
MGSQGFGRKENKTGILASRCVRKAPVKVLLVRERQDGPFQKVAACVDFSENSKLAVEQALQIAMQDGAELHLFHVFQPVAPGLVDVEALAQPINPLLDEDYIQHLKDKMLGLLSPSAGDSAATKIEAHVTEELGIGNGIIDSLNEIGADLVVLGTRGRTGLKVLLMGTTAERVIHDAPCSALAIKPEGFSYEVS